MDQIKGFFGEGEESQPQNQNVDEESGSIGEKVKEFWSSTVGGNANEGTEEESSSSSNSLDLGSKLKSVWSSEPEPEPNPVDETLEQLEGGFSLTWEQRLWGFGIGIALGSVCGFLSILFLFLACISCFAIFYTLANISYLLSTFFLVGPRYQMERMSDEDRLAASLIFVLSMIATLIVALWLKMGLLALFFVVIQSLALFWYSMSYIPGARNFIKNRVQAFSED